MDFFEIAAQFGALGLILAALLAALWRIANRLVDDVVKPVAERTLKYFDAKEKSDDALLAGLQELGRNQREHMDICRAAQPAAPPVRRPVTSSGFGQ